MFVGNIENIDRDGGDFHAILYSVLEYLKTTDFSTIADGAYPLPHTGFVVKVERYSAKKISACRPEAHEKFIDVQFIAAGEEIVGWCPLSPALKISAPYDEKKDVVFYENLIPESSFVLSKNSYAIFFPVDVHRPCGAVDEKNPAQVTKVVVKVPVEMILEDDAWTLGE